MAELFTAGNMLMNCGCPPVSSNVNTSHTSEEAQLNDSSSVGDIAISVSTVHGRWLAESSSFVSPFGQRVVKVQFCPFKGLFTLVTLK